MADLEQEGGKRQEVIINVHALEYAGLAFLIDFPQLTGNFVEADLLFAGVDNGGVLDPLNDHPDEEDAAELEVAVLHLPVALAECEHEQVEQLVEPVFHVMVDLSPISLQVELLEGCALHFGEVDDEAIYHEVLALAVHDDDEDRKLEVDGEGMDQHIQEGYQVHLQVVAHT